MSILTRDEFERLLCNTIKTAPRAAAPADVYRDFFEGTLAAYDAALARIAELESPAHRARIAREFLEEAMSYENPCTSLYSAADDTLMRWEAAAKEGE